MLVYGIRCAPVDLPGLTADAEADYYMDYGLLVFPSYTKATCVHSHGRLTPAFWADAKRVIEHPHRPHTVNLEQPYITDGEKTVLATLRESYPSLQSDWYYVPRAVIHASSDDAGIPSMQVSDLP